jgi:hypothetical protein
MEKNKSNIVVFLDNIGRTIIGKKIKDTKDQITLENPALVHINANPQTNQLQLQILPLFFREFLADRSEATTWHFNKHSITLSDDVTFAFQFIAQYEQMFQVQPEASTQQKEGEVVRLFDDEETK